MYSVFERLKYANVPFEADDSPLMISKPCVVEPLPIVGIPTGQKHSRRLLRNLSMEGVFLLVFVTSGR